MNHVKRRIRNLSSRFVVMISVIIFTTIMATESTEKNLDDASINVMNSQLEREVDGQTENHNHNGKTGINKRDLPKVQLTLLNILKPVPIVDTIKEEEKYGNTGDKFNRIGRGIVGGVETLSNLLNSALNFPIDAVKKISRSATEALNNLGGKLVGLQK